jgi:Methyl-accepting chemotaxis protein (MCP) signalling domain
MLRPAAARRRHAAGARAKIGLPLLGWSRWNQFDASSSPRRRDAPRRARSHPVSMPHRVRAGPRRRHTRFANPTRPAWSDLSLQAPASVGSLVRRSAAVRSISSFRTRVETVLKTVNDSARTMKATATESERTSQRANGMVQASNEASINVTSAANATNELSASIAEISRHGQTSDVVFSAVSKAKATSDKFNGLAQATRTIGDVVKLIGQIAGQTNLLALNATIEAARAGSEVKSLAVQTASATNEIAGQITALQTSTSEAVDAIQGIEECMGTINTYASAIAASVEQQSKATGIFRTMLRAPRRKRAALSPCSANLPIRRSRRAALRRLSSPHPNRLRAQSETCAMRSKASSGMLRPEAALSAGEHLGSHHRLLSLEKKVGFGIYAVNNDQLKACLRHGNSALNPGYGSVA